MEEQYSVLETKIAAYREEKGFVPSVVALEGLGVYACGKTKAEADEVMDAFKSSLAVRAYAKAFSGAVTLPSNIAEVAVAFAESQAEKTAEAEKRISQKIMIVTGGYSGRVELVLSGCEFATCSVEKIVSGGERGAGYVYRAEGVAVSGGKIIIPSKKNEIFLVSLFDKKD
jgi:hypothetical protein